MQADIPDAGFFPRLRPETVQPCPRRPPAVHGKDRSGRPRQAVENVPCRLAQPDRARARLAVAQMEIPFPVAAPLQGQDLRFPAPGQEEQPDGRRVHRPDFPPLDVADHVPEDVARHHRRPGEGEVPQIEAAQVERPRLEMPSMRTRPPVPLCRGTRPSQAANSRPDLNAAGSPIAATAAVALSTRRRESPRCAGWRHCPGATA